VGVWGTEIMQHRLSRRALWIAAIPLVACAGYTAGYLLAPPARPVISRSLPPVPDEAPQPQPPALEVTDEV
jgi:hypothetical protein